VWPEVSKNMVGSGGVASGVVERVRGHFASTQAMEQPVRKRMDKFSALVSHLFFLDHILVEFFGSKQSVQKACGTRHLHHHVKPSSEAAQRRERNATCVCVRVCVDMCARCAGVYACACVRGFRCTIMEGVWVCACG
jgi:hypothetical protein